MNSSYSITSKGQVTIPKELRKKAGIGMDDRVSFTQKGKDIIIRKEPNLDEVSKKLRQKFKQSGIPPASQQDYNTARSQFIQDGDTW